MRRCLGGLALAIVLGWTGSGQAAERPARLTVAGNGDGDRDACVSEEAVRLAVARRLGTVPFDAAAEDAVEVTVEGDISAGSGTASSARRATIVWAPATGRGGTRSLTAPDCAALTDRIAVTISVLLEARPAEEVPRPVTVRSSEREPSPFDEPEKTPGRLAVPQTHEAEWRLRVALHGGASLGSTPAAAPSAGAGVEVTWPAFAIGAGGRADLATSTHRPDGKGVRASLVSGELFACGRVGRGRGHDRLLGICALGLVGALLGEGINVVGNDRATSAYAALGPRLTIDLPLGASLGVRGLFDVVAPFTRATLRVEGDPVWTAPVVQVRAGLGLTGWIL